MIVREVDVELWEVCQENDLLVWRALNWGSCRGSRSLATANLFIEFLSAAWLDSIVNRTIPGLLVRAVHCNCGLPALWVFLPTDLRKQGSCATKITKGILLVFRHFIAILPDVRQFHFLSQIRLVLASPALPSQGRSKETLRRGSFTATWREPKVFKIYVHDLEGRKNEAFSELIDGSFGDADYLERLIAMQMHRKVAMPPIRESTSAKTDTRLTPMETQ